MEANLSPRRRRALESAFGFFWGATAFLESMESAALQFDDRLKAADLRESAVLAEQKIIEAFPELLSWLAERTNKKTTCRDKSARRKRRRSAASLSAIADLIGSVDGLPVDLSARKKDYLRSTGYR